MEPVSVPPENKENAVTNVAGLKEKCPAFKDKCPFDTPAAKELKEQAKECPAFKNGCTFENAATIQDVYEKLSKMPDVSEGSHHQKAMIQLLKLIHSVSSNLKGSIGDCPAFSSKEGCPFKTLSSNGKPLVLNLDTLKTDSVINESVIEVKDEIEKDLLKEKSKKGGSMEKETVEGGAKLADQLKKGTMKVHRQAERVHFVKEFMKGRVEQKIYREAVAALYFIYSALEEESDKNGDHPLFKNIHFPRELSRVESLKKDLQFYFGDDWKEEIQISDAAKKYVDHIHAISERDPVLLISHHYTRYLGDLSGGQILKKMAVKAYQLPENGEGVCFYEFENIQDHVEFKNSYRMKLDSLRVDEKTADKLVEEAKVSFVLNIELFKELDRLAGFEEEIVHEDVETVPVEQTNQTAAQESSPSGHIVKDSDFDWLKVLAAFVIAIATLVGITVNFINQK